MVAGHGHRVAVVPVSTGDVVEGVGGQRLRSVTSRQLGAVGSREPGRGTGGRARFAVGVKRSHPGNPPEAATGVERWAGLLVVRPPGLKRF